MDYKGELWLGKQDCTYVCTFSESQVNWALGFKRVNLEIKANEYVQPWGSEPQDNQEMVVGSEPQTPRKPLKWDEIIIR